MAITRIKTANRDEWLKLRSGYIGGSDAGAVAGLNPYTSPMALWAEKTGKTPPFEGNLTTKVGAYLEDLVAQLFTMETGIKVHRVNFTVLNDRYPWACANIDRLVTGEKALLEIKTSTSIPVSKQVLGLGKPVNSHLAQVYHYLAVTELERAYIAYLINNRELQIITIDRDEDEINALMEMEREFWEHVQSGEAPAPIGAESDDDTLKTLYPDSDGSSIELFGREGELNEYGMLTERIKSLETERDAIAQRIKGDMGAADRAFAGAWKISWGNQSRKSLDSKRFEADHPGMLAAYQKTTNSRVFRVAKAGV